MKMNKFTAIILSTCFILCTLASSGCNLLNPEQTSSATSTTTVTYTTTTTYTTSTTPTTPTTPTTYTTTTTTPTTPTTSTTTTTTTTTTTHTPLPPMTSDSLLLAYEDDFGNPDSGWTVSSNKDVCYSYINGEYNILVSNSSLLYYCRNTAVGVQGNFVFEVDARVLSSVDTSEYGVSFRRNDNGEYYAFLITGNHYSVWKYVQSEWYSLQGSTESSYIKTDGSKNNLKIACLGTTIEVYVNGQRLATLDDGSLASGRISLLASGLNTSVNYDNFKLYTFTNSYIKIAAPYIPVINNSSLPDGEVGVSYYEVLTASGGTPPYYWKLTGSELPEGLSLNTSTGAITGTPTMEGQYDFTIGLTSSTGETTQGMSIYISELVISTDSLANAIMNVSYNQVLQASGGKPPYTWSIVSGSLPGGLVLDGASGAISGVPAQSCGPVTLIFWVVDSAGASATEGLSLTIKLGDFQAIDQYADNTPKSAEASLQTLVNYLVIPCRTDIEKARVIYRWIAQNIDYDVFTFISGLWKTEACPDQSAGAVFARRNAICGGYANLFLEMAGYAGLQAVKISGWARTDFTDEGYAKDHAWNAVQVGGEYRLLDVTWGAGYTDENEQYVRRFNDFWFLTPPYQFIYNHYPDDASWQFLVPPVPVDEIAQYPVVYPGYFIYGLNFGDYNYGIVTNSAGTICIQAPPDVLVWARIFQNDTELADSLVFSQRQDNSYQISVRLPYAGDYELRIYARWKTESEGATAIIYELTSNQSILNQVGFPTAFEPFKTAGAYLYSPMTGTLQAGTSQYFQIMVPGAREVVVIMNEGTSSESWQYLSKDGQLFQGTFNIVGGRIRIAVRFTSDDQYQWLLEYNG